MFSKKKSTKDRVESLEVLVARVASRCGFRVKFDPFGDYDTEVNYDEVPALHREMKELREFYDGELAERDKTIGQLRHDLDHIIAATQYNIDAIHTFLGVDFNTSLADEDEKLVRVPRSKR